MLPPYLWPHHPLPWAACTALESMAVLGADEHGSEVQLCFWPAVCPWVDYSASLSLSLLMGNTETLTTASKSTLSIRQVYKMSESKNSSSALWCSVLRSQRINWTERLAGEKAGFYSLLHTGVHRKMWLKETEFGIYIGGSDGKESTCNKRDLGSIPGSGRSPEEVNGNPL